MSRRIERYVRAKQKAAHRIDVVVALAMAALVCVQKGQRREDPVSPAALLRPYGERVAPGGSLPPWKPI